MNEAFVSVRLGEDPWLVRLAAVREILPMVALQELKVDAPGCVGMLNLRGEVLPVFLPHGVESALSPSQFILVTAEEDPIGLVLDGVDEVLELSSSQLSERLLRGRSLLVASLDNRMVPILVPSEESGARV